MEYILRELSQKFVIIMIEMIAAGQVDNAVNNPAFREKMRQQNITEFKKKILNKFGIEESKE
jgi:hypothetical protein